MSNKKLMLLTIFLVSLFAVSAVSAADNATAGDVSLADIDEANIASVETDDEVGLIDENCSNEVSQADGETVDEIALSDDNATVLASGNDERRITVLIVDFKYDSLPSDYGDADYGEDYSFYDKYEYVYGHPSNRVLIDLYYDNNPPIVKIDGVKYSAKLERGGCFVVDISKLSVGTHKIFVGHQNGLGNRTKTFTVKPKILIKSESYYLDATKTVLKLPANAKGKLALYVSKKPFKNNNKGKLYKLAASNKGIAAVSMNGLAPGRYYIYAKYTGGDYAVRGIVKRVVVYPLVELKTVEVKKSAKGLVLKATLINGKKVHKNKPVTFKFAGKTYKAKTNSKGVAAVSIPSKLLSKLVVGKKVVYQATFMKDTVKKAAVVKK